MYLIRRYTEFEQTESNICVYGFATTGTLAYQMCMSIFLLRIHRPRNRWIQMASPFRISLFAGISHQFYTFSEETLCWTTRKRSINARYSGFRSGVLDSLWFCEAWETETCLKQIFQQTTQSIYRFHANLFAFTYQCEVSSAKSAFS